MTQVLVLAAAVGFSMLYCIIPDAVNAEAFRRMMSGGIGRGVMVELGSAIGDGLYAFLGMAGVTFLFEQDHFRIGLGLVGSAMLLYFAWKALLDSKVAKLPPVASSRYGDFATGALIELSNPMSLVFWVGVGGSLIEFIGMDPTGTDLPLFFIGFMSWAITWAYVFPFAVMRFKRYLNIRTFRAMSLACAYLLTFFAIMLLWQVISW